MLNLLLVSIAAGFLIGVSHHLYYVLGRLSDATRNVRA
jgi:hypothetical protein